MPAYKDEKKGTWYCKFRYVDWQGNTRGTTRRGFKTKREAKEFETNFKNEALTSPQMTVGSLAKEYLLYCKDHCRESTCNSRSIALKNYILPYFKDVVLTDVTALSIAKWQAELKKKCPESSIKTYDTTFSAMLNFAVKFYNLKANPFKIAGHAGKMKKRIDIWSMEDFMQALSAANALEKARLRDVPFKRLVLKVLFFSGLRHGELSALTLKDFDFERNLIKVSKTYNDSIHKVGPPKTDNSYRNVSIPPQLMDEVQKYFARLYTIPEYPLRISESSLRYFITNVAKEAGIKRIVIHGLRHSHISHLVSINIPIPNIAKRVGDTVNTILNTYVHPTDSIDNVINEKLNDFVGQTVVKLK